jgi:16S rRNA (adenine1518-N6/adenine1519-N6)-dimethyltransferase
VLLLKPKSNFFPLKNPKNLEKLTRIFFMHRRKMLKKPYNTMFNGNLLIANKLNLNLNLRPQNLDFETYYKLTDEFENLVG